MKASELESKLPEWAKEFAVIAKCAIEVPDNFWAFLAARIADVSQGNVQHEDDVVRVMTMDGNWRSLRVKETHVGGLLKFEHLGVESYMLGYTSDVHPDDRDRLDAILERLVRDGKVKESA